MTVAHAQKPVKKATLQKQYIPKTSEFFLGCSESRMLFNRPTKSHMPRIKSFLGESMAKDKDEFFRSKGDLVHLDKIVSSVCVCSK